eukprot:gene21639-biopygen31356
MDSRHLNFLGSGIICFIIESIIDVVRLLLEYNADPNQASTTDRCTPVFMAALHGHVDVVKLLLENNADPNKASPDNGCTPVCMAAQEGHVDVAKLLLEYNADPNKATTDTGCTPVWMAAQKGHFDVVNLLLESKADPNKASTDNGCTPVFMAALHGHVDVVKLLLENNADPNKVKTNDGVTPLHLAAHHGKLLVAQLLVVHGASMSAIAFTMTPAVVATLQGHQSVIEWLTAVATWSPLQVAAALRMHSCITVMLQQGRLDPDDRTTFPVAELVAVIAASTAKPEELPWVTAPAICRTTIKLVHDASFGWKHSTHRLYHVAVKKAVFAVLVVEDRLERTGRGNANKIADVNDDYINATADAPHHAPLPLLPPELWLFIMHFFQRSWWHVGA